MKIMKEKFSASIYFCCNYSLQITTKCTAGEIACRLTVAIIVLDLTDLIWTDTISHLFGQ